MEKNARASKKQQELLQFVDGFIKGSGYGPSYREIMRALGYKSVSTVATHIDGLIAKGYLRRHDQSARSLEIVSQSPPQNTAMTQAVDKDLRNRVKNRVRTDEDKRTVVVALKLLGYDEVARSIEETYEDK